LEIISRYSTLDNLPVFVDECDPAVGTIYGVYDNPNFVVTNTEHYPTFVCALAKRILDLSRSYDDRVALFTTWAFYMEGKRFFEGNRTLVTNENVEKPVLNAFRALARMGDTRLGLTSTHSRDVLSSDASDSEVDGLAALSGKRVTVLVWHQADDWWRGGTSDVTLKVERLPFSGDAVVRHFRIDGKHSNAYTEWVSLGKPEDPSPAQLAKIKDHQGLEMLNPPQAVTIRDGSVELQFDLPLHGTSLVEIEGV
jgi:xylan 1,4-beta-xylosidase